MVELVTFGVILDDIVCPDGRTQMAVLGGGGPQTAWGMAAALGGGARVGLVAGVGADLETPSLAPLSVAGIDMDGLRTTEYPTPRAWQVLEHDGRRTQVWRVPPPTLGVQLARNWDVLPPAYRAAKAFHWGVHPDEAGSLPFARRLREQDQRVSLEPFKPPDQPMPDDEIRALLAACDVFSPNWFEATRIAQAETEDAILARFRALGGRILALRRGEAGASVWDLQARRGVRVPAVETNVVDTVGAGNAFCGALLARLDDGLAVAAAHASVAASYMIEQVGLPLALPDPDEYRRRLETVQRAAQMVTLDETR